MSRTIPAMLVALLLPCGIGVSGARGDDLSADLAAVQGVWTRTAPLAGGKFAVFTKVIRGNTEEYAETRDGKVAFAQRVTFRLVQAGPVRLFTFTDAVLTAGPDAGKPGPSREGAYVYRIVGGRWFQANGLLDDPREVFKGKDPRLVVWERQGPAPPSGR